MSTKTENCPVKGCCEKDYVQKALCKIGITRSCLITLALVPFAWNGVLWAATAVKSLWDVAVPAVQG
jgi:hypothetical protein